MLVLVLFGACGTDDAPAPDATASVAILPTTGQAVTGTGVFERLAGVITLELDIANAAPGVHGMHIHQVADCAMDGMAAGGHWDAGETAGDPDGHGLPDGASHVGDLGNITISADGTGALTRTNATWTLDGSATDVTGHAIIFHALTDDGSMPSAGARHGCGIIVPDLDPA
ncbi:MAG: superoxide dismutase family protein [Deltaproteobacteria bacterium]|nr:superoxide dismutase family protein [Deltaproteobacteria bacterium]